VVIDAKSAFPKIAGIYATAPLEVLKARQAFGLADQHSDILDAAMLKAAIQFRGDALGDGVYFGGAPRNLRAEKQTEALIPDILAAFYVEKYSSPDVKAEVTDMAENMRHALDRRLAALSWMSPASKAAARKKLADMQFHIGFPDRFDDYANLEVHENDLYGNDRRSAAYQWHVLVAKLGQRFDRSIWQVQPEYATFNYVPTTNIVEIPAALLVSPFFDIKADKAVNYGSVGTTLSAMIVSPFFTKKGLQYDVSGRLRPWLSPQEMAQFSAIREKIADQYSAVEALPGLHLHGELLGDEALGDLAGLEIALDAYEASLNGVPAPILDGRTAEQRFFLGRAQAWQAKFVESFIRSQTATGSNEPPFMRVNGLLPNMERWYAAFDVKPGDKLYRAPSERLHLW
jgi:putative endopeptidase